jgi:hypothetical protein
MPNKKKPQPADTLTTTAQAIGSTLGKLAVKVGIATPPPKAPVKRKSSVKKKAVKKAAPRAK